MQCEVLCLVAHSRGVSSASWAHAWQVALTQARLDECKKATAIPAVRLGVSELEVAAEAASGFALTGVAVPFAGIDLCLPSQFRGIDDLPESGINGAFSIYSKVSLGSVDEIAAIGKFSVEAVRLPGDLEVTSSMGEVCSFKAHPAWKCLHCWTKGQLQSCRYRRGIPPTSPSLRNRVHLALVAGEQPHTPVSLWQRTNVDDFVLVSIVSKALDRHLQSHSETVHAVYSQVGIVHKD
eukprot:1358022-Amphidinium_carterae.1